MGTFRGPLLWVGIAVLICGCTSTTDGVSGPATVTASSATTSSSTAVPAATTTQTAAPLEVADELRRLLSSDRFAAKVAVEMELISPAGEVRSEGSAIVIGPDSDFRLITDLSTLDQATIDIESGLVGPGYLDSVRSHTIMLGRSAFWLDGDRWMGRLRGPNDDTTVGHILDVVAASDWIDVGIKADGEEQTHRLEPRSPLKFDLTYFDIDPSLATETTSATSILVSEDGFPRLIQVDLGVVMGELSAFVWSVEYSLEPLGNEETIEPPLDAWVSINELRLRAGSETASQLFDLALPVGFEPIVVETNRIAAQSPISGGTVVDIATTSIGDPPIDLDEAVELILEDLDASDAASMEAVVAGHPAAAFTLTHSSGQPVHALYVHFSNRTGIGILIQYLSPGIDKTSERALFDQITSTLKWTTGGAAVPGTSIGSELLQNDTKHIVLEFAEALRPDTCGLSQVVYTEFIESDGDQWTEDWYIASCESLDLYPIQFTDLGDQGTMIGFSGDPQPINSPGTQP